MSDNNSNVDNLSKYGPTFQLKVLANLLSSTDFLQQSLDVINPKFFESEANQWIVNKTLDYYSDYKTVPTLEVFRQEMDGVSDETLKISIKEQLKSAFKRRTDDDLEYVKDSFLDFAKNQAIKSAIITSVDLLQVGKYADIKDLVDRALRAGQPKNIGHNWKEDVSMRLSGMSRITIPTGWNVIDELIGGGLAAGELGLIAAPTGGGKSWALTTIAANAARMGKRVVYYTFELNENYVGLRFDTIYTGIEPKDIPDNPDNVHDAISNISGDIIIKFYPTRSITVHTIAAHVEHLTVNNLRPDLIIIDYADLLRPTSRSEARYQELGIIYEEIRGMSGELGIPCWTASQTQRSSVNDEVIQADKISESFSKIMTADLVISLSRRLEDKASHTARAHLIKNRFGEDGLTFPVYMNTKLGRVEVYDENSSQGQLLKKQMENADSVLKKTLAKKFSELHEDFSEE